MSSPNHRSGSIIEATEYTNCANDLTPGTVLSLNVVVLLIFVILLGGCIVSAVRPDRRDLDDRDRCGWWPGAPRGR